MGWLFWHCNRKEMIADLTKRYVCDPASFTFGEKYPKDGKKIPAEANYEDFQFQANCLKSCYRGGHRSGVLWIVWENILVHKESGEVFAENRYIGCYLLHYHTHQRGYKDMDEESHPYYYSCPLSYLEMVPVACEEWRAQVRDHHGYRGKLSIGQTLILRNTTITSVIIESIRPLKARDQYGVLYHISRKHIAKVE